MVRKILNFISSIPLCFVYVLSGKQLLGILKSDMELYRRTVYLNSSYQDSIADNLRLFIRLIKRHTDFRNIFIYRALQYGISPFSIKISIFKALYPPVHDLYMTPYPRMEIAPGGLLLYHPFSTIINAKRIGRNVIIRNNTTIGNTGENLDNSPVIGDNVNIGVGSIIIGKITIGSNVIIGAGSVVVKNLPDNCVAAGNPARIIRYL